MPHMVWMREVAVWAAIVLLCAAFLIFVVRAISQYRNKVISQAEFNTRLKAQPPPIVKPDKKDKAKAD